MIKNKTNLDCKISVIIPCFKCSDTIDRAIMSVVNQSLSPYEIILIEDYSDDNSRTINKLITLQAKFKGYIKIIKNKKNMGPGFSRNLGWTRSKSNLSLFGTPFLARKFGFNLASVGVFRSSYLTPYIKVRSSLTYHLS